MPKSTKELTFAAMVIALYIVVMFFTQSFAFGAYQIRIATALYALAYNRPYMVIPMGLANFTANALFGGMLPDMVGGFFVGCVVGWLVFQIGQREMSPRWVALPIFLVPAFGVALWLAPILNMPYWFLVANLLVGQALPALVGVAFVQIVDRIEKGAGIHA